MLIEKQQLEAAELIALPPGLELTTTFVFGVHSAAQDGGAGKVLGPFLRTLAARAVMKAKGLTPAQ